MNYYDYKNTTKNVGNINIIKSIIIYSVLFM